MQCDYGCRARAGLATKLPYEVRNMMVVTWMQPYGVQDLDAAYLILCKIAVSPALRGDRSLSTSQVSDRTLFGDDCSRRPLPRRGHNMFLACDDQDSEAEHNECLVVVAGI